MGGLSRFAIRAFAMLVPADLRSAWRRQWLADLHHQRAWLMASSASRRTGDLDLLRRAAGAGYHAAWLRVRQWRTHMLLQDFRYAARDLRRRAGFSLVVILTVGLGIGANATIFSWIDALAFNALPGVADEPALVVLHGTTATRTDLSFSYPNYRDLRDHLPAGLTDVLATRNVALAMRVGGGEPERIWAEVVTGNYFAALGAGPALGRLIAPADDGAELSNPVVVLSDRLWRARFGSRADVLGTTVAINGRPYDVIGVTAPGFKGALNGLASDAWVPISMQRALTAGARLTDRGNGWLSVIGRMAPGASRAHVQVGLTAIAAQLARTYPTERGRSMGVFPLSTDGAGQALLPVMSIVMAVVAVVLIIASTNIAGLMLAQGSANRRETAIRLAIGASRGQIVRQHVIASLLLAGLGGLVGLGIAEVSTGLLAALLPPLPFAISIPSEVNRHVLLVAAGAIGLSTLIFGLVPAWQTTRPTLIPALRDGAGATAGRLSARLRRVLVTSQVALALLLLICAGLFGRAMLRAQTIDLGFAERRAILASLDLAAAGYDEAAGRQFYRSAISRLLTVPGVRTATVTTLPPLSLAGGSDTTPTIDGYQPARNEEVVVFYSAVGAHYFDTLRQPLLAGRGIDEHDSSAAPLAIVINETLATRYFRGRDAIGGRLDYGSGWATVVGVAANAKYSSITEPPRSVMYVPIEQVYRPTPTLIVATAVDPATVLPSLRRTIAGLNPNLPLFEVRTLEEQVAAAGFAPRTAAWLLSGFGGLSALLAAIGLYGVVAFHVSTRTREIGLRMALGAPRTVIRREVFGQGVRLALIGLAIGMALAAAVTPLLASQLVGVRPYDPLVVVATSAALLVITGLATWTPAWRASRIDPIAALRND